MSGSLHLPEFGSAVLLGLSNALSDFVQAFFECVSDPVVIGIVLFLGCGVGSFIGLFNLSDIVPEQWEDLTCLLGLFLFFAFVVLAIAYGVWRSEYGT